VTETLAEATLDQQLFIVEAADTGEALLYGYLWSHESDAAREDPAKDVLLCLPWATARFPGSWSPQSPPAIRLTSLLSLLSQGCLALIARHGRGGVRDGAEGVAGVGVGDEGGGVG